MKSVIILEMMTSQSCNHSTCCIAILRHQLATSTINQSAAFHSCLYVLKKTTFKTKAPQTSLFTISFLPSSVHPKRPHFIFHLLNCIRIAFILVVVVAIVAVYSSSSSSSPASAIASHLFLTSEYSLPRFILSHRASVP